MAAAAELTFLQESDLDQTVTEIWRFEVWCFLSFFRQTWRLGFSFFLFFFVSYRLSHQMMFEFNQTSQDFPFSHHFHLVFEPILVSLSLAALQATTLRSSCLMDFLSLLVEVCIGIHCTALHCTALHCTAPHPLSSPI